MKKYYVIGAFAVVCSLILALSLNLKGAVNAAVNNSTVSVTGYGEKFIQANQAFWKGYVWGEGFTKKEAADKIPAAKQKFEEFMKQYGLTVVWEEVDFNEISRSVYQDNRYVGSVFDHYNAQEHFSIKSNDVQKVHDAYIALSTLGAEINFNAQKPIYTISQDVISEYKLSLIDEAKANAEERANRLISGFSKIAGINKIDVGQFVINTNADASGQQDEEYYSVQEYYIDKKLSVTVHATFTLK